MYLNEFGYAELFDVPSSVIELRRHAGQAFKRCEVTNCTFTIGGTYNEKHPDVSQSDIDEHMALVQKKRDQMIYDMMEKENARRADVLVFGAR